MRAAMIGLTIDNGLTRNLGEADCVHGSEIASAAADDRVLPH